MSDTELTRNDLDQTLKVAREQGLPEAVHAQIDGAVVILTVADGAAVQEWAQRLQEPVRTSFGVPLVEFTRRGYTMRVIAGSGRADSAERRR